MLCSSGCIGAFDLFVSLHCNGDAWLYVLLFRGLLGVGVPTPELSWKVMSAQQDFVHAATGGFRRLRFFFCYAHIPVANSWQLQWLHLFCVSCHPMKSVKDIVCKCAHARVLCGHVLISVSRLYS